MFTDAKFDMLTASVHELQSPLQYQKNNDRLHPKLSHHACVPGQFIHLEAQQMCYAHGGYHAR